MRLAAAHLPAAAPPADEQVPAASPEAAATAREVAIPRPDLRCRLGLAQTEQGSPRAILIPAQSEPPAAGSRNHLLRLQSALRSVWQ